MLLEIGRWQALQLGEKVVPEVVLDMSGGADEDAAHEEAEEPSRDAYRKEQGPVPRQFLPRDAQGQVVDGLLKDPRGRERNDRRGDDREEPLDEVLAIRPEVSEEPPEG